MFRKGEKSTHNGVLTVAEEWVVRRNGKLTRVRRLPTRGRCAHEITILSILADECSSHKGFPIIYLL